MKRLIPILIVLLITGCKKLEMVNQHDSNYDILIAYNYYKSDSSFIREYKDKEYLRDGNLYLIFESDFYKDTLIVSVNGKGKFSEIITTEASSGVAKHLKFENIETINTIGIRINNGKEAVLEIDTMNFFLVDYHDALLKIRVPKSVPFYE